MKLKRNFLTTLLVVSFLLMALSGCGQQAEPDSAQPPLETVTYSNLTDADSRKLLTEALADANVMRPERSCCWTAWISSMPASRANG